MANQLRMAEIHTIEALWRQGWSGRRIAGELDLNRETVAKYIQAFEAREAKPANVILGKSAEQSPNSALAGSEDGSKPATQVTLGSGAPKSKCQTFHETILAKLEIGLSAQRIYQDLVAEERFDGSYQSVKRYVRKLRGIRPLPFRRIETGPAEDYPARGVIVSDR